MAGSNLGCVIVAVDGSEESMNGLRWALDSLKLRPSASLTILHVQSPPSIVVGMNPGAIPFGGPSDLEVPAIAVAIEAHQRRITQAILDHAMKICTEKNIYDLMMVKGHLVSYKTPCDFDCEPSIDLKRIRSTFLRNQASVKTQVVIGNPKEKICEVAESLHADLLVLGCRAFGPIKRMFLESVSNYCINHARCPVIIIKGKTTS